MKTTDVVVIGGGFAGVTAARELSKAGHSVTLLEGRDRLGGRTWYRKFEGREQHVEIGGTWIAPRRQNFVQAELERYGIGTFSSPQAEDFRWGLEGRINRLPFPLPAEEWSEFERAMVQIAADARRICLYDQPLGQAGLEDLDLPFTEYVAALDLPRATSEFLLSWPTFYFGAYPQKLSALHVLSWVTAFGSAAGWYTELTDKIAGGTSRLIESIIGDSAVDVRLETPVQSIVETEKAIEVTTRFGDVLTAAAVVVATPINTWNNIEFQPPLQGSHAAMATEKQQGESVKIWALVRGLDKNLFGVGWHTRLKWIATEYTTDEGSYVCAFASAAADLDPHNLEDITRAIHEFAPEAEVLATDAHDWNRDEFSEGTWMAYGPGQVVKHSHGVQKPHGRVAFAGSDLANGWAGWIDGAIESGFRASSLVGQWLATEQAGRRTQPETVVAVSI